MNSSTVFQRIARLDYLVDLLRELVVRDMKLRYKRSVFGFAWSVLNPLAQLLVLNFIFRLVLPLNIPNYPAFLFVGLLVWGWFQSSLLMSTGSVVENRDLIRRPGFPVSVLPFVPVTTNFIHFLLALPILIVFLLFSRIQLTSAILALPVVLAIQFILTLGFAYLVSWFHVTFRDTQYLLGIFLMLGFYLSPVFYDPASIPSRYQLIYHLNPMVVLIDAYRTIFIAGQFPAIPSLVLICFAALILFWLCYTFYLRASRWFVEEL